MKPYILLIVFALMAGCATYKSTDREMPRQELNLPRSSITGFLIEGRLAVARGGKNKQANIVWQHTEETDRIILSTALGVGLGELQRQGGEVRMIDALGRSTRANDWDALAEKMLDIRFPMSSLPRVMVADVPANGYDSLGRPLRATLQGWQVSYPEYISKEPNALPGLVELRRDDIEVRIKVDKWVDE